jgi:hypothetical protein
VRGVTVHFEGRGGGGPDHIVPCDHVRERHDIPRP